MDVFRCLATNNPVGTDTRPVGQPCSCDVCKLDRKLNDAVLEVERLKDANMKLLTECDEQARGRGEAEGKLRASEMAGVVEGWMRRAEAAEAAWNTTETALRTLIDECTNETGEWSRMPRFWVIKKARAALKEDG